MTQKKQVVLIDASGSMMNGPKGYYENTLKELAGIVEEARLEGRDVSVYAFGDLNGAHLIANSASTPDEVAANIEVFKGTMPWGGFLEPSLRDAVAEVSQLEGNDRRGIGFTVISDDASFLHYDKSFLKGQEGPSQLDKVLDNPNSTVDLVVADHRFAKGPEAVGSGRVTKDVFSHLAKGGQVRIHFVPKEAQAIRDAVGAIVAPTRNGQDKTPRDYAASTGLARALLERHGVDPQAEHKPVAGKWTRKEAVADTQEKGQSR